MSETTTDDMRALLIQQFPLGEATRAGADFDAWHRKELAKAWEEGARAGLGASTDAGFNSASYTYEEAEISNDNPYKKEA